MKNESYTPLHNGKIVKDLGTKYLVNFTYSPTMYLEDLQQMTLPIKKENVMVNEYGIVTVKESIYGPIMQHCHKTIGYIYR